MKKQIGWMALVVLSMALQGCAHSAHNRGSIVVRHTDTDIDVCLGRGEGSEGDRVTVYRHECTPSGGQAPQKGEAPSTLRTCKKILVGSGAITRVVDEHYSTVQLEPGLVGKEGFTVEKN